MKLIKLEGKFYRSLDFFANIAIINICFFIGSIPIITIGTSLASMHKLLFKLKTNDLVNPWQEFLNAYKENFKQATLAFLIHAFLLTWSIFFMYLFGGFQNNTHKIFFMIMTILLINVLIHMIYCYPLIGRYQNVFKINMMNALNFAYKHYLSSVGIVVIMMLIYYCMFYNLVTMVIGASIFITFGFALINYFVDSIIYRWLSKYE